jgi:hypothetical protein
VLPTLPLRVRGLWSVRGLNVMSNWCQGFCTLCGTGCAQYCETTRELRAENAQLTSDLADADRVSELAKARADRYQVALEAIAAKGGASPGDTKHEIAALALRGSIQNKLNSGDS